MVFGKGKSFRGGRGRIFQDQGEAIPPIKKAVQGHSAGTAIGIVRVNDLNAIIGKVNQREYLRRPRPPEKSRCAFSGRSEDSSRQQPLSKDS
jgi:hypothetical protein